MSKWYLILVINIISVSCSSIPERCLEECTTINQKPWIYDIQEDRCYCRPPLDNIIDKFNRRD